VTNAAPSSDDPCTAAGRAARLPASQTRDAPAAGGHPKGEEAPEGGLTAGCGASRAATSSPGRTGAEERQRNA
jgi:hypothetical protein